MVLASLSEKVKEGISYAFGGLIGDIGGWLLVGIAVAGVISYFIPPDFFHHYATGEFSSLLLMLALGIPLYICATASTPVAAALVLKGLSPGAALVLLLAGPATNAATLTVITRLMGRRVAGLYLVSIAICSLFLGWVVNRIYATFDLDISRWMHGMGESGDGVVSAIMSMVLLVLIARSYLPFPNNRGKERCGCGGGVPAAALRSAQDR